MINAEQEANLAAANQRAKFKQDKKNPHLVNIEDGRLMPNILKLRNHPMYRVYAGPANADAAGRLAWLAGQSRAGKAKLVNSKAEEDVFDVGTATLDEIVVFAMENYGLVIDTSKPMKTIRKQVMEAAEKAEKAEAAAGADLT